jgi:nucleotide-binding universal stress UspA family protein
MFKNILIATDGSEFAGRAVTNGLALAKSMGAKVHMILVDAPMHAAAIKRQAGAALKRAAEQARLAGVPCETIRIEHDHPDRAIVSAAKDKKCDLIIMASHGHGGLTRALLGSVTHDVLRHTTIPVLVWR